MTNADSESKENVHRPLTLNQKVLVLLGAAVGLAGGFGPCFFGVAGIMLKPMAFAFGWNRADVSILPTLGFAGIAISAPLIGYIADRTGWRKVTGISIALFPLGLLALSVSPPSHAWIVAVALLTGVVGAATTAVGYVAILSHVFDRRLGMALGFMMIGNGVGATAMPIVAARLLQFMDWRQAYACIAGLSLLLGVVAYQLIFRILPTAPAVSWSLKRMTERKSRNAIDAGDGVSLGQAIRSYRFWLIGFIVNIVSGTTLGGIIHLASSGTDRGISPMVAAQAVGLVGFGVAVTRVATGFILDKLFAPLVASISILLGAVGFYLLTTDIAQSVWILPFAALLIGIATGAEGDIIPFLARRYFGIRAFGSIYGALFAISTVGAALGPYVYGLSFDRVKSYMPIHFVAAILCFVCGLAILTLGHYRFATNSDERHDQP